MKNGNFPIMNRVTEVLRRMDDNSSQPDAMKTCFGVLAIMSREDVNKLLIARDGMETILNVMTQHVDKTDIQESGCDLIWSLAFNNTAVKDTIAKHGGASVLVRALKRHSKSPEFLKSACGALSNMCQSRLNQEGIASQGGLQPLVGSIHVHQNNQKLLPFIFDALASLIVSNEENARTVSSLGIIPLTVSSLARHKQATDVVKSGCHALAILSDVKGQASKIAFAGGVSIILSLLDVHPTYSDLHRVAAVVILRMLQESSHVGREITCNEGVRIFLKSLEKGGAQQDTVAAVTHILFTVTNPSSPASANIESQLWIRAKAGDTESDAASKGQGQKGVKKGLLESSKSKGSGGEGAAGASLGQPTTALGGLVTILGQYKERRDVVRAACRLLNNLGGLPGVVATLEKLDVLDKMLECVGIHTDTRDVVDSCAALLKAIHRRGIPCLGTGSNGLLVGLLHVMNAKHADEDVLVAGFESMAKYLDSNKVVSLEFDAHRNLDNGVGARGANSAELKGGDGSGGDKKKGDSCNRVWERELLLVCVRTLDKISGSDEGSQRSNPDQSDGGSTGQPSGHKRDLSRHGKDRKLAWSKNSPRIINGLLSACETYYFASKKGPDLKSVLSLELVDALRVMAECMPVRIPEITKRVEKIVGVADVDGYSQGKLGSRASSDNNGGTSGTSSGNEDDGKSGLKGRKTGVRPASDKGAKSGQKSASEYPQQSYNMEVTSSGYAIPQVWRYEEGEGNDGMGSGVDRKLYPLHPNNYFIRQPGQPEHTVPRLLESWPTYLERLLVNPSGGINRSFNMSSTVTGERMHTVYESGSAAGKGLMSRAVTPIPYQVPVGGVGASFEHSLTFDSEFESGNLLRAVQRGDANYDLFLRADLHTAGHTQWFYFAVANTHPQALVRLSEQGVQVPPVRVRFNIVNLTKPDSLFNMGMRPIVYSCLDAATKNVGWVRGGSDISYYSNTYARNNTAGEGVNCYYTLSFTIEFQNAKDTTLIAYSYPYGHTDYKAHISRILAKPNSSDYIRSSRLCHTLSGESCDLLVITNFKNKADKDRIGPLNLATAESYRTDEAQRRSGGTMGRPSASNKDGHQPLKPAFFLSCRVHPGETPASWMMKGALDFLTSDCSQAQMLRQVYVIFIVPMLNPDGVIYGNNRCSLAGVDLNRQWKIPMKGLHPTVFHLKALMQAQRRLREVLCYVDLHGHSRKYNVFMYGCDEKKKSKPQVRAFPRFFSMHHIGKKYVCYSDCSFNVRKGRESTARVVVAREMNIPCSYTLEATFCGSNYGPLKHCHMHVGHLQETGAAMCDAILNFSISEGKVQDALLVPANVKAVAQIEAAISEEDGTANTGSAIAIMNDNRPLFDSMLAKHLQNQQANRLRLQQQQRGGGESGQGQVQGQGQQRAYTGPSETQSSKATPSPVAAAAAATYREADEMAVAARTGGGGGGYALPRQVQMEATSGSGGSVPALPGMSVFPGVETTDGSSGVHNNNINPGNPHFTTGAGDKEERKPGSQSQPDPSSLDGFSVGLEGEGAGLGTLDTTGSATPSGRTTPAAGGFGGDLDSDSDVGMNSDSDSVRDGSLSGREGQGPNERGGASKKSRLPHGASASSSSELTVGMFKPSDARRAMNGAGGGGDNLQGGAVRTGHAELRRTVSTNDDGSTANASVQFEEMKRKMPNVRTSLSSTMPSLSSSNNADQLAALANAHGGDGSSSPLQPPQAVAGGGVSSREQLISKVDKGPYDNNKGVQGDNSSALKASGYRVMDDMAIQGMGQGQGRGLGSSQGADTNGVLTSPVTRSGKKKKLGGTKGSSSAKGRGN